MSEFLGNLRWKEVNFPLAVFALMCVLPSGMLLPVKLASIFGLGIWSLFNFKALRFAKHQLYVLAVLVIYLTAWLLQGAILVNTDSINILGFFFNVLMLPILLTFYQAFVRRSPELVDSFLALFVIAVLIFGVFKYTLVGFIIVGVIQVEFLESLGISYQVFHMDIVSTRVTFSSDYFFPLATLCVGRSLVSQGKRRSERMVYFYVIVFSLFALLTYIRSIWALQAIVLFFIFSRNLKLTLISLSLILALGIFMFLSAPDALEIILRALETKLFDESSLSKKDIQSNSLLSGINIAPFFGHGAASFSTEFIANAEKPYLYEVQTLALVFQMGLVGASFYFLYVMSGMFFIPTSSFTLFISFFFILLILVFSTNPLLLVINGFIFIFIPWLLLQSKAR